MHYSTVCVRAMPQVQPGTDADIRLHTVYIPGGSWSEFPDSFEDDKSEKGGSGRWNIGMAWKNAAGFKASLGFRCHVTTAPGALPKPFRMSAGISSLTRWNLPLSARHTVYI